MKLKTSIVFAFLLSITHVFAQESKEQVIKNVDDWYEQHPDKYTLSINKDTATAMVTSYYPKRVGAKNNLIRIFYNGMKITLAFSKPLYLISTNKDSLQKHFNYVAIDDIYNEINADGWNIYPQTPLSSLRGEGVEFSAGGDSISLVINWSTYTVMGYKDSEECRQDLSIADGSVRESCYVSVRKQLPLEIIIDQIPID